MLAMFTHVPNPGHDVNAFQLGAEVRRALAIIGMSEKAAALTQGIDQSEFSKQLSEKQGHYISLTRLLLLPQQFWAIFLPELAAHFGFRIDSQDAITDATAKMLHACANVMRLVTLSGEETQPKERKRA